MSHFIISGLLPMSIAGSICFCAFWVLTCFIPKLGGSYKKTGIVFSTFMFIIPFSALAKIISPLAAVFTAGSSSAATTLPSAPASVSMPVTLDIAYSTGKAIASIPDTIEKNTGIPLMQVLAIVYLAGMVFSLCAYAVEYFLFFAKLAGSYKKPNDEICTLYSKVCAQYNIKNAPAIYTSTHVSAPLLAGLRKKTIVLPSTCTANESKEYAISHELIHLLSRDIEKKFIIMAVCVLHWFNPLTYLMRAMFNSACEQNCDEKLVSKLSQSQRFDYAQALLSFSSSKHHSPHPALPARPETGLKRDYSA